jgi:hypothetical protein
MEFIKLVYSDIKIIILVVILVVVSLSSSVETPV